MTTDRHTYSSQMAGAPMTDGTRQLSGRESQEGLDTRTVSSKVT